MTNSPHNMNVRPALPILRRTAAQIKAETDRAIAAATRGLDDFAANRGGSEALSRYAAVENELMTASCILPFYKYVSADSAVRAAGEQAEQRLSEFAIEAGKRPDVFARIKELKQSRDHREKVDYRYLDKVYNELRRQGLDLPEDRRKELATLECELSNICIKYNTILGADTSFLLFSKEELDGVPASVLEQFEVIDGKFKITYKAPDLHPVLKHCRVADTRRQLFVGAENRVPENEELFSKALTLREQIAKLLGYKNHAEYVLEDRMAKSPETVHSFLNDLFVKARPLGEKEKLKFLELKKEEDLDADEIYAWDSMYYQTKFIERNFNIDDEFIAEHFPMEPTIEKMFNIYEQLMGLSFEKVDLAPEHKWHDDVSCYAISQNGKYKGYLYLDMYPRDHKYGHFANFGLCPGFESGSEKVYPYSALVCNFPKPTADRPSLMYHRDVVTLFHELGHGIHATLGLTKYARFSGTNVARDFVETPSQLLENWTWDPRIIRMFAAHYKTGASLPEEILSQLVASRNANQATFLLRQLFFGIFDLRAHTVSNFKPPTEWRCLRDSIIGLPSPDSLAGYNQFAHLMGGYDSGYYGYLWALVFAADIWHEIFQKNPLDRAVGQRYCDTVLSKGSSVDEATMLRELLQREPSNTAFLREIGLA